MLLIQSPHVKPDTFTLSYGSKSRVSILSECIWMGNACLLFQATVINTRAKEKHSDWHHQCAAQSRFLQTTDTPRFMHVICIISILYNSICHMMLPLHV